jgi:hypothetical protein
MAVRIFQDVWPHEPGSSLTFDAELHRDLSWSLETDATISRAALTASDPEVTPALIW